MKNITIINPNYKYIETRKPNSSTSTCLFNSDVNMITGHVISHVIKQPPTMASCYLKTRKVKGILLNDKRILFN